MGASLEAYVNRVSACILSRLRRLLNIVPVTAVVTVALCTCFQAVAVLSMAPLFPLLEKEWDLRKSNQLTMITGSSILVLGYGNFVAIPFSNVFGRRAAVLVFGVLFLACQIWQALARSYGSFIGARSLVGLAAAPSETIVVQVVADLFFLHERGAWVGFSMYVTLAFPMLTGSTRHDTLICE